MRRSEVLWGSYVVLYVFILYAPLLFLTLFALSSGTTPAFPIKSFTLRWFEQMASSQPMFDALWNSIKVATVASLSSTILGSLAAKALARRNLPGKSAISGLISLPLIIPGIVIGIALLILVNSAGLGLSLNTIRLAHTLYCIPFAVLIMLPRFEELDKGLEEASRDLGEGLVITFFRVIVPLAAPAFIASLLLTFTISLDEFVLAFFLAGTETTLPLFIWSQLRFPGQLPIVLALSTCILCFSFVLVSFAEWLRGRGA